MNGDSQQSRDRIAEANGQLRLEFNTLCPHCRMRVTDTELRTSLWGTCRRCEIALIETLPFGAN